MNNKSRFRKNHLNSGLSKVDIAYIEAFMSISYGLCSEPIVSGYNQLRNDYKDKVIGGIDFGIPFGYFDKDKK